MNTVLRQADQIRPVAARIGSEGAQRILGGFELTSYDFGPKDLFVQATVVGTRH